MLAWPLDATVVVLVLLSMLLLSEYDFATTWGIRPAPADDTGTAIIAIEEAQVTDDGEQMDMEPSFEPAPTAPTMENNLEVRCAHIARHFGLTRREEEVLALLAKSRSVSDIEGELFISHNTAKGHIRHVYAKLGIHSRDEAADLVRNWQQK